MSRGDQLARQWKIIQLLVVSKTGRTAAEIADSLECRQRTVYRDLEALQSAGFPVYNETVAGRHVWALLDTVDKMPLPFTFRELMALYFGMGMLEGLQNTEFYSSYESLLGKIRTTLPPQSVSFLTEVQRALYVSSAYRKDYGQFKDIIALLSEAAITRSSVDMVYFTMHSRKEKMRRVDPYKIWFFNGTLYLVGHCHLRGDIRTFTLDRIKSLEVTGNHFSVPDTFSMESLVGSSFGIFGGTPEKVIIEFDAAVAGYIEERIWHTSQKISARNEGAILFEAEIAVTEDLKSWILSWGSKARVLEPEKLKEQIRNELLSGLQKY